MDSHHGWEEGRLLAAVFARAAGREGSTYIRHLSRVPSPTSLRFPRALVRSRVNNASGFFCHSHSQVVCFATDCLVSIVKHCPQFSHFAFDEFEAPVLHSLCCVIVNGLTDMDQLRLRCHQRLCTGVSRAIPSTECQKGG